MDPVPCIDLEFALRMRLHRIPSDATGFGYLALPHAVTAHDVLRFQLGKPARDLCARQVAALRQFRAGMAWVLLHQLVHFPVLPVTLAALGDFRFSDTAAFGVVSM